MAERAAAEGIHIKRRKRGGKQKEKVDTTGTLLNKEDGDESNNEENEGEEGDVLHSLITKFLKDKQSTERVFEANKYTAEYAHPTVIQVTTDLLKNYLTNGVKLNYYLVQLLRRISTLPNDAAGVNPLTNKPFTFQVMLYHVHVFNVVTDILGNRTIQSLKAFSDVRQWALEFSQSFLKDTKENPLLFVEALFWRSEKNANAEVAQHYGLLIGNPTGYDENGNKIKRKTKAAIAADEAEAEARKNKIYVPADNEGEAQASFSDLSSDDSSIRQRRKQSKHSSKKNKYRSKNKYRKNSSGSDSDSSNSSSNSSSSSSSSNSNVSDNYHRSSDYQRINKEFRSTIQSDDENEDMDIFSSKSQQRLGAAYYDSEEEDNALANTMITNSTTTTTVLKSTTVYDEDILQLPNPLTVKTPLVRNHQIDNKNTTTLHSTIIDSLHGNENLTTMVPPSKDEEADNEDDEDDDIYDYRRAMQKRQQQRSNATGVDSQISIRTTAVIMDQI